MKLLHLRRTLLLFGLLASTLLPAQKVKRYHEFWPAAGYNRIRGDQFFDAGLRWYSLYPDGQAFMAFSGASAGCEFSLDRGEPVHIPYLGWQGQVLMLGYGARLEYASDREQRSVGCSLETGFSLFEVLRVMGGYRLVFGNHDPLRLRGFRFSLVASFPLDLAYKDDD